MSNFGLTAYQIAVITLHGEGKSVREISRVLDKADSSVHGVIRQVKERIPGIIHDVNLLIGLEMLCVKDGGVERAAAA